MADRVEMRHPDLTWDWDAEPRYFVVESVPDWESRGWKVYDPSTQSKAQLHETARKRGMTVDPSATKEAMLETLTAETPDG